MRFCFAIIVLAIIISGCNEACCQEIEGLTSVTAPSAQIPDGLNQDNIDAVIRVRNRQGSGTGSIISGVNGEYVFITNHHVAGRKGSANTLDIWNNGSLVQNVKSNVQKSWFDERSSKDIAIFQVPQDQFKGELPVIPLAAYGNDKKLKPGDKMWQVGCDSGNWPNAERGRILKVENGLIYYLPDSIPGNSGGPVYNANGSSQIGVTAWYTRVNINGRVMKVGLAMSSDRVRDIIAGRTSSYPTKLPAGATPIEPGPYISDAAVKQTAFRLPQGVQAVPLAQCPPGTQYCPIPTPQYQAPSYQFSPVVVEPQAIETITIPKEESITVQTADWRKPGSGGDGRRAPARPEIEKDRPELPVEPEPKGGNLVDVEIAEDISRSADALEKIATQVEASQTGLLDLLRGRGTPQIDTPRSDDETRTMVAAIKKDTTKILDNQNSGAGSGERGGILGLGLLPSGPLFNGEIVRALKWGAFLFGGIYLANSLFGPGWLALLVVKLRETITGMFRSNV